MESILSVKNLRTCFFTRKGTVNAVDDISFDLQKGELMCIVGESGSGKTITALSIMRLIESPGKIIEGKIIFNGENLLELSSEKMQDVRGNKIAMVFQDPHSSLNPVLTIGYQIVEAMTAHKSQNEKEAYSHAIELLELVGIPTAKERYHDYPHQFSGGMKQRVVIAMALACHPMLLIADEPTTALDLTVQAQILDLFIELRKNFFMSIIYITHDLGVVSEIADSVVVMYAGKIMEKGSRDDILNNPLHPYTTGLIGCMPSDNGKIVPIPGTIPSLVNLQEGCVFHPRCIHTMDICRKRGPPVYLMGEGHYVTCFLKGNIHDRTY
ncbi:MAG: ABC transporter ATP-binding protein [Candidatus Methanoperedens sp.]|nr:ABC transporter ATP-binding protein [Candidatus Methanoperedens sp.]